MTPSDFRTDRNNNPTAFTTDVAKEGGLSLGKDYEPGDPFDVLRTAATTLQTARLLGDPIALTIRVIDALSFETRMGTMRWVYIAMPHFIWMELQPPQKRDIIGWMYQREGGEAMRHLFPKYGFL